MREQHPDSVILTHIASPCWQAPQDALALVDCLKEIQARRLYLLQDEVPRGEQVYTRYLKTRGFNADLRDRIFIISKDLYT